MAKQTDRAPEELGQTIHRMKDQSAVQQLLRSEDTRRMMDLLGKQGGVQNAARAAAQGDTAPILAMMQQLMSSKEGAQLVERITKQAQQSGL